MTGREASDGDVEAHDDVVAVDVVYLATAAMQVARTDRVVETNSGADRQLRPGLAGAQVGHCSHTSVDGIDEARQLVIERAGSDASHDAGDARVDTGVRSRQRGWRAPRGAAIV